MSKINKRLSKQEVKALLGFKDSLSEMAPPDAVTEIMNKRKITTKQYITLSYEVSRWIKREKIKQKHAAKILGINVRQVRGMQNIYRMNIARALEILNFTPPLSRLVLEIANRRFKTKESLLVALTQIKIKKKPSTHPNLLGEVDPNVAYIESIFSSFFQLKVSLHKDKKEIVIHYISEDGLESLLEKISRRM
jgi:predicted XRE-type DNA-binding protein